jgi:hypothetical protein
MFDKGEIERRVKEARRSVVVSADGAVRQVVPVAIHGPLPDVSAKCVVTFRAARDRHESFELGDGEHAVLVVFIDENFYKIKILQCKIEGLGD